MSDDDVLPPTPASESVPQELNGVERRILADSAAWERHIPSVDAFNQRLRRSLTEEHMREPDTSSVPTWLSERAATGEYETPLAPNRRPPSRTRTLLAVAAAVVIVGLLAAVFAGLTQSRTKQEPAVSATTTASATITATPATPAPFHMLAARPPVIGQPGTPVVAPSDPNVIYEYADNGTGVVVRRSDDGGQTWRDLSYPSGGSFVSAIEIAVSPADAQNVFLRLDLGYPQGGTNPCQAIASIQHGGILASGDSTCRVELSSRDGGAHWSRMTFPVAGTLFQGGVTFSYDPTTIQAGADRLYGRIWQLDASGTQNGDVRIVSTRDQGQTWQTADTTLVRQASHICSFRAAPASATIFAITSTTTCWGSPQGARSVWRSDDAGVHWARAGDLPAALAQPDAQFVAASESGANGVTAIFYGVPGAAATAGAAEVLASSDGGQTWHAAPTSGLPAGTPIAGVAGTALPDGSVLVAFSGAPGAAQQAGATPGATATPTAAASGDSGYGGGGGPQISVVCYVWKVGEAKWQRVTQAATIDGASISNVFASNGSQLVVTLSVASDNMSSNPTYVLERFE